MDARKRGLDDGMENVSHICMERRLERKSLRGMMLEHSAECMLNSRLKDDSLDIVHRNIWHGTVVSC